MFHCASGASSVLIALILLSEALFASFGLECGAFAKREVLMPRCSAVPTGYANGDSCSRSYLIYIPESVCTEAEGKYNGSVVHADNLTSVRGGCGGERRERPTFGVVPVLFALHCYRCSSGHMMHFKQVAEDFSFVLVIPIGLGRSWNARYCCGYALRENIDDLGFLRLIVQELANELLFVRDDVTYAVGWSNGGYMATYAASTFRAVAPISGHIYDGLESIVRKERPVGLFMHHGSDDHVVSIAGCCGNASMPRCCCGISDASNACVSAIEVFERWGELNGCDAGMMQMSTFDERRRITCSTGAAAGDVPCRANATLCIHGPGAGHFRPSLAVTFSMTKEIGDFFARDACESVAPQGKWVAASKTCECTRDTALGGAYCLGRADPGDLLPCSAATERPRPEENAVLHDVVKVTVAAASAGFFLGILLVILRVVWPMVRYRDWTRVALDEDDKEDANRNGIKLFERENGLCK